MKPCQLCGAKSWGPIDTASTEEIQVHECTPFLLGKDLSQYRRCDGCGTFASLVQMALEDPPRRDPVEESLGVLTPGPANPMAQAFAAMKNVLPVPETRLERLVRALLGAAGSEWMSAPALVSYARQIERELEVAVARITDIAHVEVDPQGADTLRLTALEAFAQRIRGMTEEGGILEAGTSNAARWVGDALRRLREESVGAGGSRE